MILLQVKECQGWSERGPADISMLFNLVGYFKKKDNFIELNYFKKIRREKKKYVFKREYMIL